MEIRTLMPKRSGVFWTTHTIYITFYYGSFYWTFIFYELFSIDLVETLLVVYVNFYKLGFTSLLRTKCPFKVILNIYLNVQGGNLDDEKSRLQSYLPKDVRMWWKNKN